MQGNHCLGHRGENYCSESIARGRGLLLSTCSKSVWGTCAHQWEGTFLPPASMLQKDAGPKSRDSFERPNPQVLLEVLNF